MGEIDDHLLSTNLKPLYTQRSISKVAGCSWTVSRDRKPVMLYACALVFSLAVDRYHEMLIKHRFASHVIQKLLNVAAGTIAREVRRLLEGNLRSSLDMYHHPSPSFSRWHMGIRSVSRCSVANALSVSVLSLHVRLLKR